MRGYLWNFLKNLYTDDPWIICGDMNRVMHVDERIFAPVRRSELEQITQCMHECKMIDVKSTDNVFTWNNKQHGSTRVYSKIDKVMANHAWLSA